MQPVSSTPLAAQAGAIAAAIRAEASHQARKAGMVAALHALILSALARLVASLENLVQLWQAGLLPPRPTTPAQAAPIPREPRPRSAARHSHVRVTPRATAPRARVPAIILSPSPQAQAAKPRHPAQARAHPPDFRFFAFHTPSTNCNLNVPIS